MYTESLAETQNNFNLEKIRTTRNKGQTNTISQGLSVLQVQKLIAPLPNTEYLKFIPRT
jgi:hypothetical protein